MTPRSEYSKLKSFLEERGATKKVANAAARNPTPENLRRAGFLSKPQMVYIDEIRGLTNPDTVRKIKKKARRELGDAGAIVEIFAATHAHSIEAWEKHRADMVELEGLAFQQQELGAKNGVDWAQVVWNDAVGALSGAAIGAVAALASGAASASLVFGPQGAVVTITGSAVSSAVQIGVGASALSAGDQAYESY